MLESGGTLRWRYCLITHVANVRYDHRTAAMRKTYARCHGILNDITVVLLIETFWRLGLIQQRKLPRQCRFI